MFNNNQPINNQQMNNNYIKNNSMFNNNQPINNQQTYNNFQNYNKNNSRFNNNYTKNNQQTNNNCPNYNKNNILKKPNLFQKDIKKVNHIQNIPENYNHIKSQNSQTNDIVIELENSDTDKKNEIKENIINDIDIFNFKNEERKTKIDEIIDNFPTNNKELLRTLFNSIVDENDPTIITFNSYKKNLQKIGETQSDEEIKEMFLLASQNGKLELTFDEYCNAIK